MEEDLRARIHDPWKSVSTLSLQQNLPFRESNLRCLYSHDENDLETPRNVLVVIPEFGASAVAATWQDGHKECWLRTRASKMLANLRVLCFESRMGCDDNFSWQGVKDHGDILLEELLSHCRRNVLFEKGSLFFVAHGLGGLLLQRAISVLFEQSYDGTYRSLIEKIAGIVFLGCPNPASHQPGELDKVSRLLKAVTKLSNKTLNIAAKEVSTAATISQRFSNCGLDAPVLSVFETKQSKLGKNMFSQRAILVDRTFCETLTRRERLLGINCVHEDLCNLKLAIGLEHELTEYISLALDLRTTEEPPQTINIFARSISEEDNPELCSEPISRGEAEQDSALQVATPKLSKRRKENLPCYIFPPTQRNPHFLGRLDVLQTLDEALLPNPGGSGDRIESEDATTWLKTFALCGAGGLGKSQVAIEYIYSRREKFDAIFWIHASDTGRLATDFAEIAIRLGLEEPENVRDQTMVRNLVLGWLGQDKIRSRRSLINTSGDSTTTESLSHSSKWLLVFDNAESLADLRDYWPLAGNGSILITSRDPLAKTRTYFHSPQGIDLQPFSTAESASWLRKLTGYEGPDDYTLSETIVTKLSNFPLAITQVAGAILRRSLSFEEFLEFWVTESFRAQIYVSNYETGAPIWATFAFKELAPETAALLHLMSFFDADSILESVFTSVVATGQTAELSALMDGFPADYMKYLSARSDLVKCSLLRRNSDLKALTLHRIVQDAALSCLDADDIVKVFKCALRLLTLAWPTGGFDYKTARWKQCEALYPHIQQFRTKYYMIQSLQESFDFAVEFGKLLADAAWYQVERGMPSEATMLYDLAQMLLENAPIPDNLSLSFVFFAQTEVACLTAQNGLPQAMKSLELCQSIDWEDSPGQESALARAYHEVGEALTANQEYMQALTYDEQALELHRKVPGYENDFETIVCTLVNMAFCRWRIGGEENITEANRVMEEALERRAQAFGKDDTLSTKSLTTCARAAMQAVAKIMIISYFLIKDKRVYFLLAVLHVELIGVSGSCAVLRGFVLAELGNIRVAQERWSEALEFYRRAYNQYLSVVGRDHFRVAGARAKLGMVYHRMGDLPKAYKELRGALKSFGNRSIYMTVITWISIELYKVLEAMRDPIAEEAKRGAQHELLELSVKVGKRLEENDVEHYLPSWAL